MGQPPLHGESQQWPDSTKQFQNNIGKIAAADSSELHKEIMVWMSRRLFQRQSILQWQDGPRAHKRQRDLMPCACKHTWVKTFPSGPRDNGEVYFSCSTCGFVE